MQWLIFKLLLTCAEVICICFPPLTITDVETKAPHCNWMEEHLSKSKNCVRNYMHMLLQRYIYSRLINVPALNKATSEEMALVLEFTVVITVVIFVK